MAKSRQNRDKITTENQTHLSVNETKILQLLHHADGKGLSISQISEFTDIHPRTLLRQLSDLISKKKIAREGRGPASRYVLVSQVTENFSVAQGYNYDFLESYIPNKTFLLSIDDRRKLQQISRNVGETAHAETFMGDILERLLIDLSWSSSKLEGNTYSLLETEHLLRKNTPASDKEQIETQMILNHKEAIDFLIRNIQELELNWYSLRNIHALLSDGLLQNPTMEGQLRPTAVGIDGSSYIPINVPQILQEQVDLFLHKVKHIENPFEQSFFILVFVPYLQPFIDLNKRTSRVFCNIPFLKNNLSPLSFNEVERSDYIQAIIHIYEQNDTSFLRGIFMNSYLQTSQRYQVTKKSLTAPHPLKIKYRKFIQDYVANLIRTEKNKVFSIEDKEVEKNDRMELQKVLENELRSIHEGNYAKFHILPSEYKKWAKKYRRK